jgi:predicted MFS family arabinose efflux permease
MAGANLATPLYPRYAQRFGFSSLVLTLIFTTYAVTLIPALLLFGRLSDRFGRKPVIVSGLGAACVGLLLFAFAQSTGWLFAARACQGLAVGIISGPATAALVEFDPRRDQQRPALLAGLAQAGGSGLGPLVAGMFAQWAAAPWHLSFVVMFGATVLAGGFALRIPGAAPGDHEPWRVQRPRVPRKIRRDFARVSVTSAIVWAALALFLSVVPSYAIQLAHSQNLALLGLIAAIALASSAATQVAVQHQSSDKPALVEATGLLLLGGGLVVLVIAAPLHSLVLLLAASVVVGAGHGAGFLRAQDELNRIAPANRRGEVTAAFICCIYVLVAAATVSVGLLGLHLALPSSVGIVAAALAAAAAGTALWQVRVSGRSAHKV